MATLTTYAGATADGAPTQAGLAQRVRAARPCPTHPDTPEDEEATSEEDQRVWLETFLELLLPHRADWNLGAVMWYSLRDAPVATASFERMGLRRTTAEDADGGPKPSWDAYTARSDLAELLYLPGLFDLASRGPAAGPAR